MALTMAFTETISLLVGLDALLVLDLVLDVVDELVGPDAFLVLELGLHVVDVPRADC